MGQSGTSSKPSRFYTAVFAALLLAVAAGPFIFYWSKVTKNPKEFRPDVLRYLTVEVKARDISSEVLPLIKVGDTTQDESGEENARIVSIQKVVPQSESAITIAGQSATLVTEKKDIYLTLRVRYSVSGRQILFYPSTSQLKIGRRLDLEFAGYWLYVEIVKVNRPEGR